MISDSCRVEENSAPLRVVLTGGGTGGHIYPALAVAESFRAACGPAEILYVGSSNGMEAKIVPEFDVPFRGITARKLRKLISFSTIRVALSLCRGYREARRILVEFRPQVVIGAGGYVAAATVIAASRLGTPTIIVECNVLPGRTNRLLGKVASRVCLAFEETAAAFRPESTVITGLPVRTGIVAPAAVTREAARMQFPGLAPNVFTVLVLGGSQGAQRLNGIVMDAAGELLANGVQLLHQTGARHYPDLAKDAGLREFGSASGYLLRPFIEMEAMPLALRAADVLVCRGGISTLTEALANGLPMLVVPLPTAYANHQTANGLALARSGAAHVLAEGTLTGASLAETLLSLKRNPILLEAMSAASGSLARSDAADKVAWLARNLAGAIASGLRLRT